MKEETRKKIREREERFALKEQGYTSKEIRTLEESEKKESRNSLIWTITKAAIFLIFLIGIVKAGMFVMDEVSQSLVYDPLDYVDYNSSGVLVPQMYDGMFNILILIIPITMIGFILSPILRILGGSYDY